MGLLTLSFTSFGRSVRVTHAGRRCPRKSGRFNTSGSPVALFLPKIWPEIQKKYNNPKIYFFVNLKSPTKSGRFDTSRSPVGLLVPKIWPEIQKKTKKSKNTEIQKSKNSIFFENLKNPRKTGRFDTSGAPVALFVPKISPEIPKNIPKSKV